MLLLLQVLLVLLESQLLVLHLLLLVVHLSLLLLLLHEHKVLELLALLLFELRLLEMQRGRAERAAGVDGRGSGRERRGCSVCVLAIWRDSGLLRRMLLRVVVVEREVDMAHGGTEESVGAADPAELSRSRSTR